MAMAVSRDKTRSDHALLDGAALAALLGMPGQLAEVSFRGARVRVIASQDLAAQQSRGAAPRPVTDLLHLELLTGGAEAPHWPRPVVLHAVVETRSEPLLAVQRASRWASYAARVALVRQPRLSECAVLEATLRGVWLVAMTGPGQFRVAAAGERGPAPGSARGLHHRLLDELIWETIQNSSCS
jgi:hypothetical protein